MGPRLADAVLLTPTTALPVMRLIKGPGDRGVAIVVLVGPEFRGLRGIDAWVGIT